MIHWNFGLAWLAFAFSLALHAGDEARHGFLAVYNPNARRIRQRLHLPVPIFNLRGFLITLGSAVLLLLALSPLAFHGTRWIRAVALPLAVLAGLLNGLLHISASLFYRRRMPGVLSSPVLLAAGGWLLLSCWS